MRNLIEVKNLIFDYFHRGENGDVESIVEALSDVSLEVKPESFISIIGANGSGKSTLAKNLNALLIPTEGTVLVDGKDTRDIEKRLAIRKTAGMIFQNPDNQIVGTTVETDVAFGPENLGVESEEIVKRIGTALELAGLQGMQKQSTSKLSGGQKQKLALAGVMAMLPKCMILDEATAMLDPESRERVMDMAHRLNRNYHMTIIHVTHFIEEILASDYVYVMKEGMILSEGKPEQILSQPEILSECNLESPLIALLARHFKLKLSLETYTAGQRKSVEQRAMDFLAQALVKQRVRPEFVPIRSKKIERNIENALIFDHVSFCYESAGKKKINEEAYVVQDVSFSISPGEFVGIVGPAGSGKSTLLQLMNGLLRPVSGNIYYKGEDIWDEEYDRTRLRQKLGVVFQYPEQQLFGETVYKDVVFGPYHMDLSRVEAEKQAFEAIRDVGLGEEVYDLSPFVLSGGQKRRVAIAGVLAMAPEYLILDEPTAGLDSHGKRELLDLLSSIRKERDMAVIMVSHSMEEMAEYADRLLVIRQGQLLRDDTPRNCFMEPALLKQSGLRKPVVMRMTETLRRAGLDIQEDLIKQRELFAALDIKK